jgi:hypothetical protein
VRRGAREYREGEEGTAQGQKAAITATERERAAKYVNLRKMERSASLGVVGSGELEQGEGLGAIATFGGWGQGSRREQEVRAETGRALEMGLSGYQQGREALAQIPRGAGGAIPWRATGEAQLADLANLLDKLRQAAAQMQATAEAQKAIVPAVPPALPGGGPAPGFVARP